MRHTAGVFQKASVHHQIDRQTVSDPVPDRKSAESFN